MRQLVIDTETTGLSKEDRIVELAAVELVDGKRTGIVYHAWYNPERDSHPRALEVHELTSDWLADKPRFGDLIMELASFLIADEWIIHNAPFDLRFMEREFSIAHYPLPVAKIFCTLTYARRAHELEKDTLNKLCELYDIDTSHRVVHGALTDAELLATLYLRIKERG
jgi:DNA polymerase-3 subunit epsilon